MATKAIARAMDYNQYVFGNIRVSMSETFIVVGFSCKLSNHPGYYQNCCKVHFPISEIFHDTSKKIDIFTKFTKDERFLIKEFASNLIENYMYELYTRYENCETTRDFKNAHSTVYDMFNKWSNVEKILLRNKGKIDFQMFTEFEK